MPPAILVLAIDPAEKKPVHLWLPVFILWPLLLVLAVLSLVFTALADVVLLLMGQRYHRYTMLAFRVFGTLCETRGLQFRVKDKDATVFVTVR
jgi:hypothetical protein